MPRKSPKNEHKEIKIEVYSHAGKKRKNNPPVGLVSSQTDKLNGYTKYAHDPYIDPHLSWAGKQEGRYPILKTLFLYFHIVPHTVWQPRIQSPKPLKPK